jgi:DNA replication initiation complex subunit (GINS family)
MENEKITFESIYEILREEKKKEDMSLIPASYYSDVSKYLLELSANILPDDELSQKQFLNVKRMIVELFERREAKIVRLAILSSRIKTAFVDKSKLLSHELLIFNELTKMLKEYRENNLESVLKAKTENIRTETKTEINQNNTLEELKEEIKDKEEKVEELRETKDLKTNENSKILEKDFIKVTFTKEISKFVGEHMEIFGPYSKDEVAVLPKRVANILVSKQHALVLPEEEM